MLRSSTTNEPCDSVVCIPCHGEYIDKTFSSIHGRHFCNQNTRATGGNLKCRFHVNRSMNHRLSLIAIADCVFIMMGMECYNKSLVVLCFTIALTSATDGTRIRMNDVFVFRSTCFILLPYVLCTDYIYIHYISMPISDNGPDLKLC